MTIRPLLAYAFGFVHLMAQAMAFDYPKDAVLYEGSVGSMKVKVTASARPFSRAAHQTTDLRVVGSGDEEKVFPATVDGESVYGTTATLPEDGVPQLSALTVWFGETKVDVPQRYLDHVFLPWLKPASFSSQVIDTLVAFSADGKAVYISLGVGDGGGASAYDLVVCADGMIRTAPIQRPEP